MHTIIEAVSAGDLERLEALLASGLDPNASNDQGETPLHVAVRLGRADLAACLLVSGTDYRLTNREGRSSLSLEYTDMPTLHAIRQHVRRFRSRAVRAEPRTGPLAAWCDELMTNGFLKISGLIAPPVLQAMQQDLPKMVASIDAKIANGGGLFQYYDEEEHLWAKDRAYVCNNAFKYSPALVRLCCDPRVVALTRTYLGQTAFISRGVAMRYLPHPEVDNDMFGWHHDMEDQRLKMMILLTDVGEDGQNMSYVLGSQRLFHPYEMFFRNTCSLEYCGEHLPRVEIAKTVGRAGDVFFFDSNGAHRGNRRPEAPLRDVFFVEYTKDPSVVWGGDMDPATLDAIPAAEREVFEWMRRVEHKKWEKRVIRKAPSWITNLPQVESWLPSRE